MKNDMGRKITSIVLMAIMLSGGMTIAFPGFTPDAHAANANLLVSAENTGSYVGGPQVIEILVVDEDLASGTSPDVTLNGNAVVMTATVDGNWYAYVADDDSVAAISGTQTAQESNPGLSFGKSDNCTIAGTGAADVYCAGAGTGANAVKSAKTPADADIRADWPFIQTYVFPSGIDIRYNKAGDAQTATFGFDNNNNNNDNNNNNNSNAPELSLDRSTYPPGATVHLTIEDHRLNIDPTSDDIWTWNEDGAKYYGSLLDADNEVKTSLADQQVSNVCADCSVSITPDRQGGSGPATLVIVDGGVDGLPVLAPASEWFTVREVGGPNTAVFSATNPDNQSILEIADDAKRDSTAAITYAGSTASILVKHSTATIKIQPPDDDGIWASGSAIPVVVSDGDANKNSRAGDDLSVSDINSVIPTMVIGDPFTLGEVSDKVVSWTVHPVDPANTEYDRLLATLNDPDNADPALYTYTHAQEGPLRLSGIQKLSDDSPWEENPDQNRRIGIRYITTVEDFSQRGIVSVPDKFDPMVARSLTALGVADLTSIPTKVLIFDFDGIGAEQMRDTLIDNRSDSETGFNMLNYNVESMGADVTSFEIRVSGVPITERIPLGGQSGYTDITDAQTEELFGYPATTANKDDLPSGYTQLLLFFAEPVTVDTHKKPVVLDFFSFGFKNNGETSDERIANQIVRLELEESGPDTGSLEGTLEYVMINQLNINDLDTYKGLVPIGNNASFAVIDNLTGSNAPTVTYLDVDATGTQVQVSAQQDAPSHSASVSLDAESLNPSGTVTGALVPPLERGPGPSMRIVNAFGNSVDTVSVDQQVQISYDLSNRQDKDQSFAYIVQIQDSSGVTVSLSWITGSLSGGQSFNPSSSWMPTAAGTYTVTAFVWKSLDNPTALSPPVTLDINVN